MAYHLLDVRWQKRDPLEALGHSFKGSLRDVYFHSSIWVNLVTIRLIYIISVIYYWS